jgi:hypothetical protein
LPPEFPTLVDEIVQRLLVGEDENQAILVDSKVYLPSMRRTPTVLLPPLPLTEPGYQMAPLSSGGAFAFLGAGFHEMLYESFYI